MTAVRGRVDQPTAAGGVDQAVPGPQVAVQARRWFVGAAELRQSTGEPLQRDDRRFREGVGVAGQLRQWDRRLAA